MKKLLYYRIMIYLLLMFSFPMMVNAKSGCCSHHGGVAGCNESGRQICKDGTLSPSCTCTPTINYIYGCMDSSAKNYNPSANKTDGSCQYYVYGCMDKSAKNYDENAEKDDGTCEYEIDRDQDLDDGSNGFLSIFTIGGIGAGAYYYIKKKIVKLKLIINSNYLIEKYSIIIVSYLK